MTWAKITGNAHLEYDAPTNFPNDFWGQVDVWIPPNTLTACTEDGSDDLFGHTASFIGFNIDLIQAAIASTPPPDWRWFTNFGVQATTGPATSTTYTIKFHFVRVGTACTVNWYVNGTLVATDTFTTSQTSKQFFLNEQPEGCCCETYFYTNVKIGTSDGGSDIFADDFSGGLGNWTVFDLTSPGQFPPDGKVALVAAPSAAACPTISLSPPRGLPGDTVTLTGTGFAPSSPLTLRIGSTQIASFAGSSDGSGNVNLTFTIPHINDSGTGDPYFVAVVDAAANMGCATLAVCGPNPADGIATQPPNPILAVGGTTDNSNAILDYIFHNGEHWVLWQDTSTDGTTATTFPPPTNHTMNASRISADGSSVIDYPIDTNYAWHFGKGSDNDPGLGDSWPVCGSAAPVWSYVVFFSSWSKPIYDAHFASDGTNLWVAVVTAETVAYPWSDNKDAHGHNPGGAAQIVPLATLTSGFTTFGTNTATGYLRLYNNPTGPINIFKNTAWPMTDAGIGGMGVWNPPLVVMFAFNGGGFARIGEIDAKYCPSIIGQTNGYDIGGSIVGGLNAVQQAPRGALFSRVSICASPNDPGRCHVVWSEGGDWGRVGDGAPCVTGPYGGSRFTWDGGPANRSYRVNYTTWSPTAKLTDTDLFQSHVDRTNWFFRCTFVGDASVFNFGYTWPGVAPDDFAGLLNHDLRNDNADGTPYLFAVWPAAFQTVSRPEASNSVSYAPAPAFIDQYGDPFIDWSVLFGDTLHVYDLSGGGAAEVQALDLSLFPTNAEINRMYTVGAPYANPVGPADCVFAPPTIFSNPQSVNFSPQDKAFGISLPYDDPDLGVPVYLVHLPLLTRWLPQSNAPGDSLNQGGQFATRMFIRVPCDMSAAFDLLDGDRLIGFTIIKEPITTFFAQGFGGNDFFSDEKNIWVPPGPDLSFGMGFNGFLGFWFDRVCLNQWVQMDTFGSPIVASPGGWTNYAGSQCPGFYYDPVADSITTCTPPTAAGVAPTGPLFGIQVLNLCRGCRNCVCGTGFHIAHRF